MRFLITFVTAIHLIGTLPANQNALAADTFDQSYRNYHQLLRNHVDDSAVNYSALKANRTLLDSIVSQFGRVTKSELDNWSTEEQIAYWINAYNVFTLQAIVDHYPIEWRWINFLTLTPRNSIKQIPGVWTELQWNIAGTTMTLDEIEHETLRPLYQEPRIHMAVNCASISCPPLRSEPYIGAQLNRQLTVAARDYLASQLGMRVDGSTLHVSSIFDWYGEDFISEYAHLVAGGRSNKERAILGFIATYGPSEASTTAQSGQASVRYMRYDWRLNDRADGHRTY